MIPKLLALLLCGQAVIGCALARTAQPPDGGPPADGEAPIEEREGGRDGDLDDAGAVREIPVLGPELGGFPAAGSIDIACTAQTCAICWGASDGARVARVEAATGEMIDDAPLSLGFGGQVAVAVHRGTFVVLTPSAVFEVAEREGAPAQVGGGWFVNAQSPALAASETHGVFAALVTTIDRYHLSRDTRLFHGASAAELRRTVSVAGLARPALTATPDGAHLSGVFPADYERGTAASGLFASITPDGSLSTMEIFETFGTSGPLVAWAAGESLVAWDLVAVMNPGGPVRRYELASAPYATLVDLIPDGDGFFLLYVDGSCEGVGGCVSRSWPGGSRLDLQGTPLTDHLDARGVAFGEPDDETPSAAIAVVGRDRYLLAYAGVAAGAHWRVLDYTATPRTPGD